MPTYEYECSQCGKTFDYFQSMKADLLTDCLDEECGGKGTMKRLISAGGGLIFKGSGFYATDYKKSNSSCCPATSDSNKSSSDSAPTCPHAENGTCPKASS